MSVIKFAENRLKEENEQNELGADNDYITRYWAAYLDGAKAQYKEDNGADLLTSMTKLTTGLCDCVSAYAKQMNELISEAYIKIAEFREDEE